MNDGHVRGFGRRWANHGLQQGRVSSGYLSCALGPAWPSRHVSQQLSMKMFLIAMFCGCLAFTSLSQGLVIFSNSYLIGHHVSKSLRLSKSIPRRRGLF